MLREVEKEKNPIRVILADGNMRQLQMLGMGLNPDRFCICGKTPRAETVLDILRSGVQADVLLMDTILQGCGACALLERIAALDMPRKPRILLTTVTSCMEPVQSCLTPDVGQVLLKPYHLQEVEDSIALLASDGSEQYRQYRIEDRLRRQCAALHLSGDGSRVVRMAVEEILKREEDYALGKEIYWAVTKRSGMKEKAVESAIRRAIGTAQAADTALYQTLCKRAGGDLQQKKCLSNADFLDEMARSIRLELNL